MKKTLTLGAISLLMAATPVASAFAVAPQAGDSSGNMFGTHDVTVGEVDETVYSVDINWGDLSFDWKYNAEGNAYNFQPTMRCVGSTFTSANQFDAYKNSFGLYSDNTCTTTLGATVAYENGNLYYYLEPAAQIAIKDYTTNGKIKASASFTAESDYDWVAGKIGNWAVGCQYPEGGNFTCSRSFSENTNGNFYYNSTQTDDDGTFRLLLGSLALEKTTDPDFSDTITSSDKIGEITINISPDLN